ncbi:unnamed protein product [Cladocopium goreaui]|uniref:Uncharacterized protein n=1 Tax=Cladocopium goreaui TaxID=2562237 RepID=A0A9P1CSJ0_9DINO|nr:unnamed protein product [Cladocopium goreaui]
MSLLDSEAAFKKRVIEIGDEVLFQTLDNSGLKTFSGLAFACGTPQSQPDDAAFGAFAAGVFGVPPTLGQLSQLRRLHFEACTIVFATLKSNVAGDLTDGIRKLPPAEKQARAKDQQTRLTGVTLSGEMEPSYALVDKCASMRETGSLLWIHPSQCTKREQEVQQTLKEKSQVLKIENMTLKMAADTETFEADHGTELKLMWCFQRRGLAFDQAALISWDKHESWVAAMFQAYSAEPPPSFAKVTMPQLLRADKELFTILAREVESIQPDGVGNRPLDEHITRLKTDPRVTMHLLPLPTKAHSVEASNASKPDAGKPKAKVRPGKRARTTTEVKMPDELKGGHSKTSDNKPICWAFNMKDGCSAKTYGNPDEGSHETTGQSAEPFPNLDKGTEWKDLLFVEIFAGTARLSRAFAKRDFRVSSVDHTTKRNLFAEDWSARDPFVLENLSSDRGKLLDRRRLGLVQKTKVRVIDDFKQCGVNGSTGLPEKYVLHSIDAIAATLVRALSVGLPAGETLCGTTFDLVAAYKQYAIYPEDRERVRICVKDVEQGVAKVYKISALPFVGKVRIGHTDSRRQELLAQIESHLDQNCLKPKDEERLRGRLQWYDTFLFGRIANYSMSVISKRATSCSLVGSLDPQLQRALQFLKEHVSISKPVELTKSAGKTYYIFTDGAVEPTADGSQVVASVGGILYNNDGEAEAFFSERVPQLILDMFLQHSSHPIFEVELLAVLVAAHVWAPAIQNSYVVFYIDNEAAKSALMKTHSSVLFGNVLTTCFAQLESEYSLKVWFGRVPSYSNPADKPNRFEIQQLLDVDSALVKPSWDQVLLLIERKEQTL